MNKNIYEIIDEEIEFLKWRIEKEIDDEINGKDLPLEATWLDVLTFRKMELESIKSKIKVYEDLQKKGE